MYTLLDTPVVRRVASDSGVRAVSFVVLRSVVHVLCCQVDTGACTVLSANRLAVTAERLSVVTSTATNSARRQCSAPKEPAMSTREWTNDALLQSQSLTSLLHPTLPIAVVL